MLGHKVQPKINATPRGPGLVISRPQTLTRKQRKEQQNRSASLKSPPKPPPPKPPANWLALSAERIDGSDTASSAPATTQPIPKTEPPAKPVVMEDWTLVKTKNNEIGWVLTRNLLMAIPDEVAQYAEGKHITAFFDMGTVNDVLKGPKHNWLWTTASAGLPNDFDSWRVFLWNARKHRYETSFRQHDLEGYFPVHVERPIQGLPCGLFRLLPRMTTARCDAAPTHLMVTWFILRTRKLITQRQVPAAHWPRLSTRVIWHRRHLN